MKSTLSVAVVILVALCASAGDGYGMCIALPLPALLKDRRITMIFRGTAVQVRNVASGQAIAFEVSRVWKGDVARHIELYDMRNAGDENIFFTEQQEYFVIGYPPDSKQKETMGLPASSAATFTGACSAEPFGDGTRRRLKGAAGYPPR